MDMDPNETLEVLREAIGAYRNALDAGETGWARGHAERATIAAADLDEWLSRGGFPPKDWSAER